MIGRVVAVWHPSSPGSRVIVLRRPWTLPRRSPFATLTEVLRRRIA